MINGGGSKAQNYRSHLLHVEHMLALLGHAGVPRDRITIFSADGDDPAADLATREVQPEPDFWLLRGTRLERPLGTQVVYTNSAIPGVSLRPATKAALGEWFAGARLQAGDTLFLYVTDHGQKNKDDTRNNTITLWGPGETLSVDELRQLLERLDPGVRVVALMSQCYSGAFAHLVTAHAGGDAPRGAVCGYFSSTADRPAYGCYPENRGKENVGHSFLFLNALTETSRFPEAQARVLIADQTPDVPITSSQVYLEGVVTRAARAAGQDPVAFTDGLLQEAWRDRAAWEPDIRLLDRIAQSFGIFSPRSLGEIERQAKLLPEISAQLRTHGRAWKGARGDLAQANLERFLAARPSWKDRTADVVVVGYQPPAVRALTKALLAELVPFTRTDGAAGARLRLLRDKDETANGAAYRMEVRLGAVLRMRAILSAVAGRVHLARHGTAEERAAYERLAACEDFSPGPTTGAEPLLAKPEPFPSHEEDVRLAREVLPAWMGINFHQARDETREEHGLAAGAAAVLTVYPDSPAKAAGLQAGDVILGPPGAAFTEPRQVREWTMLSRLDEPARLDVLRGDERLQVTLVPKPFPLEWPALPGPPKAGTPAPPLALTAYRGALPAGLAGDRPRLLVFWATWCGPCKTSIPEVLAFERERKAQVIAITDEPAEQLDKFFGGWTKPFPATVAIDEYRSAFLAYGVSGTPTFVLVDRDGTVRGQATGYSLEKGLALEGWNWAKGKPGASR